MKYILTLLFASANPGSRQDCIDYTYEIYYRTHSSTASMDKAVATCKQVSDLAILKLFWDWFYQSQNASDAMDHAAPYAGVNSVGKVELAKYLFGLYYQNLNSVDSAHAAGRGIQHLPSNGAPCVQRYYEIYNRNSDSITSANKAIEACAIR